MKHKYFTVWELKSQNASFRHTSSSNDLGVKSKNMQDKYNTPMGIKLVKSTHNGK